jgi:ABC-type multidrug transport system fused ATPase/permease subunit
MKMTARSAALGTYGRLLAGHLLPQRARLAGVAALLLANIALQLLSPQVVRYFIDTALAGPAAALALGGWAVNPLAAAAAAFIAAALAQQGVGVSLAYQGEVLAWTATNALREELAAHCLNLDLAFHNTHTPGELIERLDGDVSELSTFFSQLVVQLAGSALLLTGILAVVWWTDWRAGLGFSLYVACAAAVIFRLRDLAVPDEDQRRQAEAELFGFLEEQLSGTEDLRALGAEAYSLRELHIRQANVYRPDRRANVKRAVLGSAGSLMLVLGSMLTLGMGYLLFRAGSLTTGGVYMLVYYLTMIEEPLWTMIHQMRSLQTVGAAAGRLDRLRQERPQVPGGSLPLPEGALGLVFDDVSFAYQADEPVLAGLSFTLAPGKVLGLLGQTGSGKSTLARLLFRMYAPTHGRITLSGVDLAGAAHDSLRRRVALVTQEVQLFQASLRDNLAFFNPEISDERILHALRALGLEDWLASLPAGLDTPIAAGGRSLSAGEAQLLALGRAFLREPGLVVLDEASARLDPATEQRIDRAVASLLAGRTAIIIAHRLGTVRRADEILILDAGRAGEYGPRESLAADPSSRFAGLLRTGLEEQLV